MGKFVTIDVWELKALSAMVKSASFGRLVTRAGAQAAVGQVGIAFRTEGAHYGAPWAPRADSTARAIGAASKGAKAARTKAREWAEKAGAAEGKARDKALAKAKAWRAKSRAKGRQAAEGAKTGKGRKLLRDTGTLMKGFFAKDDAVGTPVRYAKYHEFGTSKMPARPVMPFDQEGNPRSPAVEAAVVRAMENMAKRVLGGK